MIKHIAFIGGKSAQRGFHRRLHFSCGNSESAAKVAAFPVSFAVSLKLDSAAQEMASELGIKDAS